MRKLAFVLASTDHGSLIVNRYDQHLVNENSGYGVGYFLLENACYEVAEGNVAMKTLELRREHIGHGVIVVDCGANIGVHTIEWAKRMTGWGAVIAIEPQERVFYALAGNIALNNCFNAHAIQAAVGAENGELQIPIPDYTKSGSFGSLELRPSPEVENIGQPIDYENNLKTVRLMTIDALKLPRLDMIKIDVERMELEVLAGATNTIERLRPIIIVEQVKTAKDVLKARLASWGYDWYPLGQNLLAVHTCDPVAEYLTGPKNL
jgi:FkbM family methyltransferase